MQCDGSSWMVAASGITFGGERRPCGTLAQTGGATDLPGGLGMVGGIIHPFPFIEHAAELSGEEYARRVVFVPGAEASAANSAAIHRVVEDHVVRGCLIDAKAFVHRQASWWAAALRCAQQDEAAASVHHFGDAALAELSHHRGQSIRSQQGKGGQSVGTDRERSSNIRWHQEAQQ